ncbi:hypothetical protein JWS14_40980 [Rhodococcus koreensis]|nr:hypothetical protein JWS14_40980 [Rhodococcus koreensis]
MDQAGLFRGTTENSAREGFLIYFGEKFYGAKWRNFKMLLVEQVDALDPVLSLGVPRIYDLYTNPKEDPEHSVASTHLWVMRPISKMIGEYQDSLKQHPPIKVGTPDPYQPPGPSTESDVRSSAESAQSPEENKR